jgi:hypothetical protein
VAAETPGIRHRAPTHLQEAVERVDQSRCGTVPETVPMRLCRWLVYRNYASRL